MKKHVRIEHVAWLPAWCNMVKHDIMEKRKFLEKNELTGETNISYSNSFNNYLSLTNIVHDN